MNGQPDPPSQTPAAGDQLSPNRQVAEFNLAAGPLRIDARVEVTPKGLWAIAALVSGTLLSASAIVWAATSVARRRPLATRVKPR